MISAGSVEEDVASEDTPSSGPVDAILVSSEVDAGHLHPGGGIPDSAGVLDKRLDWVVGVKVHAGSIGVVGVSHECCWITNVPLHAVAGT